MSDVIPVPKGRQVTDADAARCLDNYIGVYFNNKEMYTEKTLGEHLTLVFKHIIPDPIREYLSKG